MEQEPLSPPIPLEVLLRLRDLVDSLQQGVGPPPSAQPENLKQEPHEHGPSEQSATTRL